MPPYSPDIAPSDYNLFCSLKNFLKGRRFMNYDEVEILVSVYLESMKEKISKNEVLESYQSAGNL